MTSTEDAEVESDSGRQGTIFCVDCSKYMFEVDENDEQKTNHMLVALKVFYLINNCKINIKNILGN